MNFNSLDYLCFLAIALVGYWALRGAFAQRMAWLLLTSCLFYMAWNPLYILLVGFAMLLDFSVGLGLATASKPRTRKLLLLASLCGNLGMLATFKYYDFFATSANQALQLGGVTFTLPRLGWILPVGISFYTFQSLSYTIDVYRRRLEPVRSFVRFAAFVMFFPQLVAGPIVRATELLPQLATRPVLTREAVGRGLFLIGLGLAKKLAFADYVAVNLVDRVFEDPSAYTGSEVMLALYGYTLQIYCDFSGYTDVARGSAMFFGLSLPENFDRPYQATSPAEFWRRWHMTLSRWLRDYLYYPLGGSKVGEARAYFNLGLTMFLVGLWHGAGWTFVIYGLLQATAMLLHRYVVRRSGRPRDAVDTGPIRALKILGTFHFVVFSRVFFRSAGLDNAFEVIDQLLGGRFGFGHMTASVWAVLLLGTAAHYLPRSLIEQSELRFVRLPAPAQGVALAALGGLLMLVASQDVVPYIYFQF
jgi:alginate O-acetyltransferase complex protein AlgI